MLRAQVGFESFSLSECPSTEAAGPKPLQGGIVPLFSLSLENSRFSPIERNYVLDLKVSRRPRLRLIVFAAVGAS